MHHLTGVVMTLLLLAAEVASQGGCCCDLLWWSEGPAFDPNGVVFGTFKVYYELDKHMRIDIFDEHKNPQQTYISNITYGWNINHKTTTCNRTNTLNTYEQLCWDASNPLWELQATYGKCPDCEIDWKYKPTGSRWLTKHPCNAVSHWGPIMSMDWFGGNITTIHTDGVPKNIWDLPSACNDLN
eukprot:TRINITY_DN14519_c0_g1_i1.p1 TRINITY_DN14519_c0_g1~~TRINITY_DN14519_c0_g1_i1.p1  ORF type:complete len:207 (+),score=37.31 TRINITY_DN14519_c0_g1_i1:72-623(+)